MVESAKTLWFWQRIVSPHMAELAVSLASRGHSVTYVAERKMSAPRKSQGWMAPTMSGVELRLAPGETAMTSLAMNVPEGAVHLCQGVRGNGSVKAAQRILASREARQWALIETIDAHGWKGLVKRIAYRRLFNKWQQHLEGILAIGYRTPAWLAAHGVPEEKIFPFTYFLPENQSPGETDEGSERPFRFLFVGQLIRRKRLDLLIDELSVSRRPGFELLVIGGGPLEKSLRARAIRRLGTRVRWLGQLPMAKISGYMSNADCLVLPSRHDGWGAVVSEALMAGTPAICSDRCGAAEAVEASGMGGIFTSGCRAEFARCLQRALSEGRIDASVRRSLAQWAKTFGAAAGARYLESIISHADNGQKRPVPPWRFTAETNRLRLHELDPATSNVGVDPDIA